MYEITSNTPLPLKVSEDSQRHSRHSILRGTAMALTSGQSFQVPCASENDKIATIRALKRFKFKSGLNISIFSTGPSSFGVWAH